MRLTVVVPCRNGERDLPLQMEALCAQRYDDWWEVVVADNGSTDRTGEVARGYSDRLNLRVVDASQRAGQAHALNAGIRAAAGDACLLVDADDQVAPGYLAAMGRALADDELVVARFDTVSLNDAASIVARGQPQSQGLLASYAYLPYAGSGGMGLRRGVLDRIGAFDVSLPYLFDVDFCWRCALAGIRLRFVPDAVMRVRYRGDARATFRQARAWGRVEPLLFRRYRSRGMPRSSFLAAVRAWARAAVRAPELRDERLRAYYLRGVGQRVGRLQGSVRHRTVYL